MKWQKLKDHKTKENIACHAQEATKRTTDKQNMEKQLLGKRSGSVPSVIVCSDLYGCLPPRPKQAFDCIL
jgi:hypothetical protein